MVLTEQETPNRAGSFLGEVAFQGCPGGMRSGENTPGVQLMAGVWGEACVKGSDSLQQSLSSGHTRGSCRLRALVCSLTAVPSVSPCGGLLPGSLSAWTSLVESCRQPPG